jgi:hypothetical protein
MNFKPYDYVRITKLAKVDKPRTESAKSEDYLYGQENPLSLPTEYWLEGYLTDHIKLDQTVTVDRRIRNNVKVQGFFESTPVKFIGDNEFHTLNSIYKIELAKELI